MAVEERDPHSGYLTTGHEWNGIKELNTPVPRLVYICLFVTALFSLGYWILMPAFPTGSSYTATHGGRTLGISSDTAFDPSLIEWLSEADLIVHETNYGPAHTAYSDLLTASADVKKRMRLIHYPDEFPGLVGATSEIPCLLEGDVLDV